MGVFDDAHRRAAGRRPAAWRVGRPDLIPRRGGVTRTNNQLFLALKFLRRVNQPGSTFRFDGARNSNAAAQERLAFTETWLPARVDETYPTSSMPIIEGRATYSNARQFKVETDTIIM